VTSKNGVAYSSKHFSTIIKRIFSFITFQEGKTTLGSSCNARHNIQRFSQLFKGKKTLAIRSTRSCKKCFNTPHVSCKKGDYQRTKKSNLGPPLDDFL
jgi:hypothetical protein